MEIDWFDGCRDELNELFALADDSAVAVARYRQMGRILTARERGKIIGHLQLVDGECAGEIEVKSLAVSEERQGQGIGSRLLERAIALCREDGCSTLLVATAGADTRVLRFYQLLGFRMLRVERDAFTPENGYPVVRLDGIPLRDRVWLSLAL